MKNNALTKSDSKKVRNSSIELLRIIATILIIISHFSVHGIGYNVDILTLKPCFNKFLIQNAQIGFLSVDIFVIITGYFSVKSKLKIEKIIRLILQVLFYSISIYAIFLALGIVDFSKYEFYKAIFPTMLNQYWFFSSYILISLLSPFINRYLNNENRRNHLLLIIVLLFVFRFVAVFGDYFTMYPQLRYGSMDVFICYLIGAYLRLYPDNILNRKKNSAIALIACIILTVFSVGAINFIGEKLHDPHILTFYNVCHERASLLIIVTATSAFIISTKINIGKNRFINAISSCTFGVYIIHETPALRDYLWKTLFNIKEYVYSPKLIIYMIVVPLLIFVVCTIIEFIRQKTIEKPVVLAINAVCGNLRKKAVEICDKKNQRD